MTDRPPDPRGRTVTPCIRKALRNQLDNPALPIIMYLAVVGVLATAAGGMAPESVEHSTPGWLSLAWAYSLAVGGVLAVAGCLTGRTRGESAGLALLVFGLGLYGLAEATSGGPLESAETVVGLLALAACCLIRMSVLRKARKAQQVAQELYAGGPPWTS